MQRAALINGTNKNKDHDLSKISEALMTAGVIEGLQVTSGQVGLGYAFVEVERAGKTIRVLFENDANVTVDTTGTKKVFVSIDQTKVDDGSSNAVDGTGIGSIQTAASYPVSNFVPLASITGGVITDERSFVKPTAIEDRGTLLKNPTISSKSANYTLLSTEKNNTVFSMDTSGGNRTFTLNPALFPTTNGCFVFTFVKSTTDANTVTIDVGSGNTINGSQTYVLTNGNEFVTLTIESSTFVRVTGGNKPSIVSVSQVFKAFSPFGNGSDGNVTISSGTTTLVRDMFYNNLTVNSPGILNPNGYRIFVSGTFSGNGTISSNGGNGENGVNGIASGGSYTGGQGGNGGTISLGSLESAINGVAGGSSQYYGGAPGLPGSAGASTTSGYLNINGVAGGKGGGGTGGVGGTIGTSVRGGLYNTYADLSSIFYLPLGQNLNTTKYKICGGASGGGGGVSGSSGYAGGGGGGSGSSGGMIFIAAFTFTFTGSFSAIGGNGGTGGTGTSAFNACGGGGGAGGNGGLLYFVSSLFQNIGTSVLTGGTGGTGGTGQQAGVNGSNGVPGGIIQITI